MAYEDDSTEKPAVTKDMIRFNGVGDDGHETFLLNREDKPAEWSSDQENVFNFCKTACKPYDIYVTATLILARFHLGEKNIKISSDGIITDWEAGLSLLNTTLGKNLEIVSNNSKEIGDATIHTLNACV